jgi:hypothetical protein
MGLFSGPDKHYTQRAVLVGAVASLVLLVCLPVAAFAPMEGLENRAMLVSSIAAGLMLSLTLTAYWFRRLRQGDYKDP